MMNCARFWLPLWLLAASSAAAQDLPPFVQVTDHGAAERRNFPVTGAVPLPRGAIREGALPPFMMKAEDGRVLPVQAKAAGRWLDGSVKWLVLDFQSSQAAGKTAKYVLSTRKEAGSVPPLARAVAGTLHVDTGALRCRLDAKGCEISIRTEGAWRPVVRKGFRSRIAFRDRRTGKIRSYLLPVAGGRIEENGPLRAVIRVDGWHVAANGDRLSPSTVRLSFTRGRRFVRVHHTFVMSKDPQEGTFPSIALEMKLAWKPEKASYSAEGGGSERIPIGSEPVTVFQEDRAAPVYPPADRFEPRFQVRQGKERVAEGSRYAGALTVKGGGAGVGVFLRNMWRLHPKGLRYSPGTNTLAVDLWPGKEAGDLDLRRMEEKRPDHYLEFAAKDPLYKDRKYSPERYVSHTLGHSAMGLSRTHEIVFDFSGADPSRLAGLFSKPFVPFVSPEWNVRTGVLGKQVLPGAYRPGTEKAVPRMIDRLLNEIDRRGWYGAFVYGNLRYSWDKNIENWMHYHPKYAWYNSGHCENGGTLLRGLWVQYLRTGDPRVYELAEARGAHKRDVSVVHFHRAADKVGAMIRHGGYDPWAGNRRRSGAHAPLSGLFLHYYVTGDPRMRDVCRLTADVHYRNQNMDFGRNYDTDMESMSRVYRFTRDEKHYARCLEYLDHWHRNLDAFTRNINRYSYFSYWHTALKTFHEVALEKGDRRAVEKVKEVFQKPYRENRRGRTIPMKLEQYAGFAYELDPSPENGERLLQNVEGFKRLIAGSLGWRDSQLLVNLNDFGYIHAILYDLYWAERIEGLAAPEIRPAGGTYEGPVRVSMAAAPGAEIRYTLDGSDPNRSSPTYDVPIRVDADRTVRARAFRGALKSLQTAREEFEIAAVPFERRGLRVWLKADAGTEGEGDRLAFWRDQSGRAGHAVQDARDARPLLRREEGRAFVAGQDGAFMHLPMVSLSDCTAFMVASFPPGEHSVVLADGDDGHLGSSEGRLGARFSVAEHGMTGGSAPSGRWGAWTVARRGSDVTFRRNGSDGESRRTRRRFGPPREPTDFHVKLLFAQRTYRQFFRGGLAELLIFDRALSREEIDAVESYLLKTHKLRRER